ncbi:helix-turn-helix domain-containing protein [Phytobacter massiliensis]|uniref:helix-turn-helix domain-containing protein n=1 Tax=Phytobacter massiliensis TaxID=1485952 RepID=UPI0009DBC9F8|nr:helix-turn-helix domain-containing protein [Phytobacter massiliensis]
MQKHVLLSFKAFRSPAKTARALNTADKKERIIELRKEGGLNLRRSMDTVAQHPGVSRATACLYARQPE